MTGCTWEECLNLCRCGCVWNTEDDQLEWIVFAFDALKRGQLWCFVNRVWCSVEVDFVVSHTVALIEWVEERKNCRERGRWYSIAEHTEDGVEAFVHDVCVREDRERWISQLREGIQCG